MRLKAGSLAEVPTLQANVKPSAFKEFRYEKNPLSKLYAIDFDGFDFLPSIPSFIASFLFANTAFYHHLAQSKLPIPCLFVKSLIQQTQNRYLQKLNYFKVQAKVRWDKSH